jgi:hypothetical protein
LHVSVIVIVHIYVNASVLGKGGVVMVFVFVINYKVSKVSFMCWINSTIHK